MMKILVCVDGSELSSTAVIKAAKISRLVENAEVTVLHVNQPIQIPPPYGSTVVIPARLEDQIKEVGEKILNEAGKMLKANNVKFNTVLLDGHVAAQIINYASEHRFDLVVVGGKGRGRLEKAVIGSVTSALVQEVNTDVLIVKQF